MIFLLEWKPSKNIHMSAPEFVQSLIKLMSFWQSMPLIGRRNKCEYSINQPNLKKELIRRIHQWEAVARAVAYRRTESCRCSR